MSVLDSHAYWKKFGYSESSFLPCFETRPELPHQCAVYTHYPAGPYLVSSLLLNFSVKSARLITWLMVTAACAWALAAVGGALGFTLLQLVVAALLLGISRGYWLYADNLFGNGIGFALFGLLLAFTVRRNFSVWAYATLALITSLLSVELLPAIFLFPLVRIPLYGKKGFPLRGLLLAAGAVLMGLAIRALQNAHFMGSMAAVYADWENIIRQRVYGEGQEGKPQAYATVRASSEFFRTYLFLWFDHQRVMITKLGPPMIWLSCLALGWFLRARISWFLPAVYLISLQWSFLFVQHAMIHMFTFRYVAWPLALSVAMVVPLILARFRGIRGR